MPPKKKPLDPCQLSPETIATIESFITKHLGAGKKYTQFVDPQSLRHAGIADDISLPCSTPRWTLVIDTAEKDYEFLVQSQRRLGIWAVARSMKRPLSIGYDKNFFAGDFAVLEFIDRDDDDDDDDDDDEDATVFRVPSGYRVLVDAERKTIDDLISSFSDGRREAQRAEHANSSALKHIYIIEGNMDELTKIRPEDAASGKPNNRIRWFKAVTTDLDYMSFAYDSPFCIRQINSHAELVQSLFHMVKCNVRSVMDAEQGIQKYIRHSISGKRATRVIDTPDAAWSGMLQAIPGVSPAAAAAIMANQYPTLLSFAQDIVACDNGTGITRDTLITNLSNVAVRSQHSASSRTHTRLGKRGERIVDLALPTSAPKEVPKRTPKRPPTPDVDDSDDFRTPPRKATTLDQKAIERRAALSRLLESDDDN